MRQGIEISRATPRRRPWAAAPLALLIAAAWIAYPQLGWSQAPDAAAQNPTSGPTATTLEPPGVADADAPEEPPAGEPVMVDGGVSVSITRDQRATIVGDAPSLRNIIVEICRQANIKLITYAAADHRFAGRLENVPLSDALRSMLRTESYLVGFRGDEQSTQPRITWLRVMGGMSPAEPGSLPPAVANQFGAQQPQPTSVGTVSPPPDQRFSISSSLLFQAFGTFDPARRDMAQRELLERIGAPDQLPRFLAMEPKELANMFGRYRDSAQTLRRLLSISENGEITQKLTEVLEVVGATAEPATEPVETQ